MQSTVLGNWDLGRKVIYFSLLHNNSNVLLNSVFELSQKKLLWRFELGINDVAQVTLCLIFNYQAMTK